MQRYRYTGPSSNLQGTALGQYVEGVFKIQHDEVDNPFSHDWWESCVENWEPLCPRCGDAVKGIPEPVDGLLHCDTCVCLSCMNALETYEEHHCGKCETLFFSLFSEGDSQF